jgi:hypothetical protein
MHLLTSTEKAKLYKKYLFTDNWEKSSILGDKVYFLRSHAGLRIGHSDMVKDLGARAWPILNIPNLSSVPGSSITLFLHFYYLFFKSRFHLIVGAIHNYLSMDGNSVRKRRRPALARTERCQRKIKCDRQTPCSNCTKSKTVVQESATLSASLPRG